MATTKFCARLWKRNALETTIAQTYDIKVWMRKMTGMTARSASFSAVSCEASLVKTVGWMVRTGNGR